jgi:hypothetical protein
MVGSTEPTKITINQRSWIFDDNY